LVISKKVNVIRSRHNKTQKRLVPQISTQTVSKTSLAIKKTVQFQKKLAKKKGKWTNQTQEKSRKHQNLKPTLQGNFETLEMFIFSEIVKLRLTKKPKVETL
jgi:hypothetical protein